MTSSTPIAFVDTETTHLSAEIGEVWEVAVILRKDGAETEYIWQFRPLNPSAADPESLKIGRFAERFAVEDGHEAAFTARDRISPMSRDLAVADITDILRGAILVGSNTAFDDRFLRKLVGLGNHQWHYRPICIATLAAGYQFGQAASLRAVGGELRDGDVPAMPLSSRRLSRWVGVEPPGDDVAHTALGDARWARDVYDAVTRGKAVTV